MDSHAIFDHRHTRHLAKCVPVIPEAIVGPAPIQFPTPRSPWKAALADN